MDSRFRGNDLKKFCIRFMIEHILSSLHYIYPEITLLGTILTIIIADVFLSSHKKISFVIIAFIGIFLLATFLIQQQFSLNAIFDGMLTIDSFARFFKLLIIAAGAFTILFSLNSSELTTIHQRLGEYYAILFTAMLGMFLMVSATHLLTLYLAIELTSISFYILVGIIKERQSSSEASLKYILYGAFSSGVMLYGLSLFYGMFGSLEFSAIQIALIEGSTNPLLLLFATLCLLVGLGYKISIVPFHFWTPDVYEGAPITITAFLSVASKISGFALLMRIVMMFSEVKEIPLQQILIIISILTMTIGNLVALWQNNIKRFLAYSSIAHAGYLLLGCVTMGKEGLMAMMLYSGIYLFMNLGTFYVAMFVADIKQSEHLDAYKGLGKSFPFLSIAMVIFLISLTGLPPTAGFIGKLYLFSSLMNAKLVWLALIAVINSIISLYYYIRIIRNMFLRDEELPIITHNIFLFPQKILLLLLLLPTIIFGMYFSPLMELVRSSILK